uniref:Uncharacterized protein n=1 Tax=Anguilla anguilla TaxID=7936 RepID=A0A0E9P8T0_ANGAN
MDNNMLRFVECNLPILTVLYVRLHVNLFILSVGELLGKC